MYSEEELKEIVELAVRITGGNASFEFIMEQYKKNVKQEDCGYQVGCY